MSFRSRRGVVTPSIWSFVLSCAVSSWSSLASAAPDDTTPDDAEAEVEEPAAAAKATKPAAPETPPTAAEKPAAAAKEAETGLTVERLPASAFPTWTTRGLRGSSLGLSMHGMPWPYYPKTGIGVSGSIWADFGYETIKRGDPTQSNDKFLLHQSRAVLRTTPTYSKGTWYVQGQSELVANGDQATPQPTYITADDLWIRTGEWKNWDIQAGRFEAFEVYHFGMGMDVNTLERKGPTDSTRSPPEVPGLTQFVYRQNVGNLAVHKYFGDYVRVEVLGQYGFDSGLNSYGVRPAAVFDIGWLKLKASANIRKQFALSDKSKEERSRRGGTAAVQFVFDPYIEFGVNYSKELVDHYSPTNPDTSATRGAFDGLGSVTTTAYGGFANARVIEDLLVGGGINFVDEEDQVQGVFKTVQGFGAIQYLLGGQLYLKFVAGYAKATLDPGGDKAAWENTMLSGRMRLMYLF